jgi:hypothetical protein
MNRIGNMSFKKWFMTIAIAMLPSLLLAVGITAKLDRTQVLLGQPVYLLIQINGAKSSNPKLPQIKNLHIIPVGQNSQFQWINGAGSSSVSYQYLLQAADVGEYEIPSIQVVIQNQVYQTPKLRFTVFQQAPPQNYQPSNNYSQAVPQTQHGDYQSLEEKNSVGFVRIRPAKGRAYVGELIPIEIKAYFRSDYEINIKNLPTLIGDTFTLQNIDPNLNQSTESIDGVLYNVVTWITAIAPVKEGSHKVQVQMNVVAASQEKVINPWHIFDDEFFDQFLSHTKKQELGLKSPSIQLNIFPLPQNGVPEHFQGAIGQFELFSIASANHVVLGDPINLKVEVRGKGNFDRVYAPELKNPDQWKVYKPTSKFTSKDVADYSGIKTFEIPIIPKSPDINEIPPLEFSYFDPEQEKYVTLATNPIPIKVLGNAKNASMDDAPKAFSNKSFSKLPTSNEKELNHIYSSLQPLVNNKWFLLAHLLPLVLLLSGLGLLWRYVYLQFHPELIQKKKLEFEFEKMENDLQEALNLNQPERFIETCRKILQIQLGNKWGCKPDSITLAEVEKYCSELDSEIFKLFFTADAVAYSNSRLSEAEMKYWKDFVLQEIRK